jgi:phosphoglycolate phosphatase
MSLKHKAILFDLDGTLLNTLHDLGNAVNRVLSKHNLPTHELDAYRYFVGDGSKMLIIRALPGNQRYEELIETCLDEFKNDYEQNWNIETSVYSGIPDLLDAVSSRGIKLAVLSNKPHKFTQNCVQHYFPKWTFDVVLGQQPAIPQKPHPAGALAIAKQMKIAPSDFCYVGDSAVDMKTACASGMFPIGVLWGFRQLEELKASGAAALVGQPLDVLNYCF